MLDINSLLPAGANYQAQTVWSSYQEAIFDAVTNPDNLLVQAVAGSGKTTTLVEIAVRLNTPRTIFLAFNKSIAVTLQDKLPLGCTAKTFNAFGHAMMPKGTKLNQFKDWEIAKRQGVPWNAQQAIVQAVDFAKQKAIGILDADVEGFFDQIFEDGTILVEAQFLSQATKWALKLFNESIQISQEFSFGDQLYYPVAAQRPFQQYTEILVDEAQDLSPIQHLMLSRMGGRVIAVGDRAQAIYAFRGADSSSMDSLIETFQMKELPLSISYRCSKGVVLEAQRYVSHIESSPTAPDGLVDYAETIPDLDNNGMILCRNNGPLMQFCVAALKDKRPIRLLSTIGEEIKKALGKLDGVYTHEALKNLERWRDLELSESRSESRRAAIISRYEMLAPFLLGYKLKAEALAALEFLISSKTGPIVSTIHRAKGLEATQVYILDPALIGDYGQEINLRYVAITRAKHSLFYTGMLENPT